MTALIAIRSHDPVACFACGSRAIAVGIDERTRAKRGTAWTCGATECLQLTRRMIYMPVERLDAHEGSAIIAAARAVALPILTEAMTALYDIGVRNLDDATPDQFEQAATALAEGGIVSPLAMQLSTSLAIFGATLRAELSNKPPF